LYFNITQSRPLGEVSNPKEFNETAKTGNQGLMVSELGLGCMGMSEFYGTRMKTRRYNSPGVGAGVTFLDTADMYGVTTRSLSKAIQDRRDQVILATKFANVRRTQFLWRERQTRLCTPACEASLKRLGLR